jgi:hypothetical protein
MSLESATYINQLNPANPPAGDPVANAADHLRMIKSTLRATFPNITGPVTATNEQLSGHFVPMGLISMWCNGSAGAVPAGWGLCDGTSYARADGLGSIYTPDLRNRFIVGSGGTYANSTAGGSTTVSGTTGYHAITAAELPNFSIAISDPGHTHVVNDPGHHHNYDRGTGSGGSIAWGAFTQSPGFELGGSRDTVGAVTGIYLSTATTGITASPVGALGNGHAHSFTGTYVPPYFALAFIMKL